MPDIEWLGDLHITEPGRSSVPKFTMTDEGYACFEWLSCVMPRDYKKEPKSLPPSSGLICPVSCCSNVNASRSASRNASRVAEYLGR